MRLDVDKSVYSASQLVDIPNLPCSHRILKPVVIVLNSVDLHENYKAYTKIEQNEPTCSNHLVSTTS